MPFNWYSTLKHIVPNSNFSMTHPQCAYLPILSRNGLYAPILVILCIDSISLDSVIRIFSSSLFSYNPVYSLPFDIPHVLQLPANLHSLYYTYDKNHAKSYLYALRISLVFLQSPTISIFMPSYPTQCPLWLNSSLFFLINDHFINDNRLECLGYTVKTFR